MLRQTKTIGYDHVTKTIHFYFFTRLRLSATRMSKCHSMEVFTGSRIPTYWSKILYGNYSKG